MKTYSVLTLQQIIDALRALPNDPKVYGIDGVLHSDRGYYERSASEQVDWPTRAYVLADDLEAQIGKPIHGWKGGEYTVRADLPVYIAEYGKTGPAIGGIEQTTEGRFEFVGIEDTWF